MKKKEMLSSGELLIERAISAKYYHFPIDRALTPFPF